jgi:hypothetical protein
MSTTEDQTVAAGHSVTPARWQTGLDELLGRVAGRFGRVEPRRHARAFVLGLLADLPRKNCWTIAEHAGQATPTACSTCWPGRSGTSAPSATTSGTTSSSTWLTPPRCWWSTKPAISRKAPPRSGCNASTPAPPARLTTPGRRLPDLRHHGRARGDRPRATPAPRVAGRRRALLGCRSTHAARLCHQARAGQDDAATRTGCWGASRLGDRR